MWGQQFTSVLLVLGFTNLSSALPGLQAHDCRDRINGIDKESCGNAVSTTSDRAMTATTSDIPSSITSAPSIIIQNYARNALSMTVVCDIHECTFYDVSSSLVTVVTLPAVTAGPRPPFGNGTDMSQPHSGPTASDTGVLGTSRSQDFNTTTTITSRVTSAHTVTVGNWSDWTSVPTGTADGTGRTPQNSANATYSHRPVTFWSVWPSSSGSPRTPLPTSKDSTYSSSDQSSTRDARSTSTSSCSSDDSNCPSRTSSISYITTDTYTFSGSTVILPIPASFESSRTPTSHSTKTTKTHTPKHTSSSSRVGGHISTSSCWTTTFKSTSVTGNPSSHKHTTMTGSSQICWILVCDNDDNCTDRVSRYPITSVDAVSTSSMSHSDNTVMATMTTTSHGSVSATMTSISGSHTMSTWMTWSASANSTMMSSSHSGSSSSTHTTTRADTRSVDATTASFSTSTATFAGTYPAWMSWPSTMDTMTTSSSMSDDPIAHPSVSSDGSMTLTRVAEPVGTGTSNVLGAGGAMMNRKRYLKEQKRDGGVGKERK